jgi:hypothetical protein
MRDRRLLEIEFQVAPSHQDEFDRDLEALRSHTVLVAHRDAVFENQSGLTVLWVSEWESLESLMAFAKQHLAAGISRIQTSAAIVSCRLVDAPAVQRTRAEPGRLARVIQGRELDVAELRGKPESPRDAAEA